MKKNIKVLAKQLKAERKAFSAHFEKMAMFFHCKDLDTDEWNFCKLYANHCKPMQTIANSCKLPQTIANQARRLYLRAAPYNSIVARYLASI